jgi:bifunctional enzyme CysN/CysC
MIGDAVIPKGALRFLACGSVDDGKSTLIGRLVAEGGGLFEDQRTVLREESLRWGTTATSISRCCSTGWRLSANRASP